MLVCFGWLSLSPDLKQLHQPIRRDQKSLIYNNSSLPRKIELHMPDRNRISSVVQLTAGGKWEWLGWMDGNGDKDGVHMWGTWGVLTGDSWFSGSGVLGAILTA